LRHAERRDVEPLARQREQVAQTVIVLLELCIAAVATDQYVGVNKDVVGIERKSLFRHRSENQIGELCLFFFGEFTHLPGHPHAEQEVYEFPTLQTVLLEQQFEYAPALLLYLFLLLAHNAVVFDDYGDKGKQIISIIARKRR